MTNYNNFQELYTIEDGNKSNLAGYARVGGSIILLLISGLASFAFFANYGYGLLDSILPVDLARIGAGMIGILLFETAVIYWHYLSTHDADTRRQIDLARVGYVYSLAASVSVTVAWFALSSELAVGWMIPGGQTETIVRLASLILIIATVAIQFTLSREYDRAGQSNEDAMQSASYRAASSQAKHTIKHATLKNNLEKTVTGILRELPKQSEHHATQQTQEYIQHVYGGDDRISLQQNGRK